MATVAPPFTEGDAGPCHRIPLSSAWTSSLFGPSLIAKGLGLAPAVFAVLTSVFFSVPGALIGVGLIDRIGRKRLQVYGFVAASVMLALFAWFQDQVATAPVLGLVLFGLFSLLITAGPSTVAGAGILGWN